MKQLITTALLALLGVISATAQPTLNSSVNPAAGDKFLTHYCDTTGISKGASGAAVTWNCASLSIMSTDSIQYVACSATPGCASFPGASVAAVDNSGSTPYYSYYVTNSGLFSSVGSWQDGSADAYIDPQTILRYPMVYGNSFRDANLSQSSDSVGFYQTKGIDSVIYDGYGTLILPSGSINNAMRIHRIMRRTDSFHFRSSSTPNIYKHRNDNYEWYSNGTHYPILFMFYDSTGAGTFNFSGVIYIKQIAGVSALQNINAMPEFTIAPNPATENIVLTFADIAANNDITFSLSDAAGKQYQAPISIADHITNNRFAYPTDKLPAGIYFVT
ncbi:MAG: T9SS C-terminal target domain-containing protein, partial [Chitinophagia bacterium]|nr:T9SS C-terminal target domain-containing protein [Chitinophagia bacterium]